MSKKNRVSLKAGGLLTFGVLLPFVVVACGSEHRRFHGGSGAGGDPSAAGAPEGGTTNSGGMNAAAGSSDEGGHGGDGGDRSEGGETSGGSGGESPTETAGSANTGGQGGCTADSDCESPETDPPGCAEAKCDQGVCTFQSQDADGDGERALHCESKDSVSVKTGLDCDDHDVAVNTSRHETCDGKDN